MVIQEIATPVHFQQDEYYEVCPLLVAYQETITYFEIVLLSDTYKQTGLHHNLIVDGYGLWLISASSHIMLIIFLRKTRDRVFSNKGGLRRPWRQGGAHTKPLWGPRMKKHGRRNGRLCRGFGRALGGFYELL